MRTSTMVNKLVTTELRHTSVGKAGFKSMSSQDLTLLNQCINRAIEELYTKFNLVEKELIIVPIKGQTSYLLDESGSLTMHPTSGYIRDTSENIFGSDVMTILRCFIDNVQFEIIKIIPFISSNFLLRLHNVNRSIKHKLRIK